LIFGLQPLLAGGYRMRGAGYGGLGKGREWKFRCLEKLLEGVRSWKTGGSGD
jgi:hypothetical protein